MIHHLDRLYFAQCNERERGNGDEGSERKGMTHPSNDGSHSLRSFAVGEFSSGGENNARERERSAVCREDQDPSRAIANMYGRFCKLFSEFHWLAYPVPCCRGM